MPCHSAVDKGVLDVRGPPKFGGRQSIYIGTPEFENLTNFLTKDYIPLTTSLEFPHQSKFVAVTTTRVLKSCLSYFFRYQISFAGI